MERALYKFVILTPHNLDIPHTLVDGYTHTQTHTALKGLVLKSWSILDFHSEYHIPAIKKNRIFICHMFTSRGK